MSNQDEPLVFYGRSAEEAEEFIRAVNLQAFKANRMRDNIWIADFASTAFAGNALRSFRKLSPEIRHDWEKLQEALLDEYSGTVAAGPPSSGMLMPAPAAAPSLSPTGAPLPAPAFQQSGSLVGRIRCIPSDGISSTYISRYLDAHNGLLLRTQDPMHSLHVRWSPSSLPTTLETVNCRSAHQFLGGVTRNSNPKFQPGCYESLSIATTTGPTSSTRAHSRIYKGRPITGLPFADIWNILHDGTVAATLRVDDTSYALTPMITLQSNSVSLALCPKAYLASRSPGDRVQVRLVFEPI